MEKLKPCPFCGGEADMHTWRDERFRRNPTRIECHDCGCSTLIFDRIRQAAEAWNKRAENAAEAVHGYWKTNPLVVGGECSVCGWDFEWFENDEAHYCPHCGTKMDVMRKDSVNT